jgi:membrane protein implicated in regulation of membrane protease activity
MAANVNEKSVIADAAKEDASLVVNLYTFLSVVFLIVTFLLLSVPKVYLANEIYYKSKELQKLKIQAQALQEERILLERKIEKMKFQNSVIHTMF